MVEALAAAFTDNLLTCSICLGEYDDPRVLPCYHTFCYGCIWDYATRTVSQDRTFLCPLCREELLFPREGLSLKKNHMIQKAKDLLSQRQQHEVSSPIKDNDVHGVTQAIAEMISTCEKHPTNELKYYCEDDDAVVCGDCVPKEHYRHGIVPVELVANSNRKKIKAVLKKSETKLDMFKEAVAKNRTNELEEFNTEDTINIIQGQARSIQRLVEQRAQRLISEVNFACDIRKMQEANKDTFELHHASLESACRFAQELVTNGSDSDIMLHTKALTERLTVMEKIPMPTPDTQAQISYRPGKISAAGLEAMLGEVRVHFKPPIAEEETIPKSAVHSPGREAMLGQAIVQSQRPRSRLGVMNLLHNLLSPRSAPHSVFLEKAKCVHSFKARLIDDKSDTFVTGLAIAEQYVITVDGNNSVSKEGKSMTKVFTHAGEFEFDVKLNNPFDAAVSQTGQLYITSLGDKCVKVYSTSGQDVTTIGCGKLEGPRGITINKQGHVMHLLYITVNRVDDNIVISDYGSDCVHVLSPTGDQLHQYGTRGSGDGQLCGPGGVCTDSFGHIFIADYWNHRIVALSPQGQFIRYIATADDGLESPTALAINPAGYLVVACGDKVKTFQYLQ
ncbi:tripartite motif-containing protein 3-like [Lingula anatina]|uniref:Tripartite motif-containing protein 3-like n=1 Tax=Lingula anatina TaxID=7574 RepID=A0A1S3I1P4_LINAN|nr:tripartite motif-containing protein 3-like [Lingula anatina]|eukprot:XP_013392187.1 tripartite motif-containing protein 3-like [Lingula anatina]